MGWSAKECKEYGTWFVSFVQYDVWWIAKIFAIWKSLEWFRTWKFKGFKDMQHPVDIYLLKVYNRNTRARCEICLKLTTNSLDDNVVFLVSLLLTLNIFHILFYCFYC